MRYVSVLSKRQSFRSLCNEAFSFLQRGPKWSIFAVEARKAFYRNLSPNIYLWSWTHHSHRHRWPRWQLSCSSWSSRRPWLSAEVLLDNKWQICRCWTLLGTTAPAEDVRHGLKSGRWRLLQMLAEVLVLLSCIRLDNRPQNWNQT